MFFILSKVLFYLAMPITWILLLVLVALFTRRKRLKLYLYRVAAVLLLFFTNPFFANEAWLWWEVPPVLMKDVGAYDAGIILTGVTNTTKSPHDRVHFERGADRVLHALQLYREGRIRKIIISGGSGALVARHATEAAELKHVLLLAQVPEHDILLEEKSRNTHENAKYTKELLQQHPELKKLLLITSGFHMRRATACFEKQGIRTDPFSADFTSKDRSFYPDALLVPQEQALANWQRLFREVLGYLIYKVIGYA